jgi:hypothetical protein
LRWSPAPSVLMGPTLDILGGWIGGIGLSLVGRYYWWLFEVEKRLGCEGAREKMYAEGVLVC